MLPRERTSAKSLIFKIGKDAGLAGQCGVDIMELLRLATAGNVAILSKDAKFYVRKKAVELYKKSIKMTLASLICLD